MSTLQQAAMEQRNWENDPRIRAARRSDFFAAINKDKMELLVTIFDYEEDSEDEHWFPFRYEVCELCSGKGSHVDPSIDSHGLSREDFDEDPDFAEDYLSGRYNVPCNLCRGEKVYPVLNEERFGDELKRLYQLHLEHQRNQAEWEAEAAAERAMRA